MSSPGEDCGCADLVLVCVECGDDEVCEGFRFCSDCLPDVMCACGYEADTFACKIRHVQLNTGAAKAARD